MWWAGLAGMRRGLARLLDPVEQQRRAAYRERADRDRFVLGVLITRVVLGAHLDLAPERVSIDRICAHCGRPDGGPRSVDDADVRLSISHSGDLVVVAFTVDCPVGVDIERPVRVRRLSAGSASRGSVGRQHRWRYVCGWCSGLLTRVVPGLG